MALNKKKDFIYDSIVVGAGLTGLAIGKALKKEQKEFLILEASEYAGGHARMVNSPFGPKNNGLKFIPKNQFSEQAINFLKDLGLELDTQIVENHPLTYSSGEFKNFVGFGDNPPEFVDAINLFLSSERVELIRPIYEMASQLTTELSEDILTRNIVTRVNQLENGIYEVVVNGTKSFFAQKVIYTASIKDLCGILPDSIMSQRVKHKLLKTNFWTLIGLDINFNSQLTGQANMFLLDGTVNDEFGPSVGLFSPVKEGESGQYSQWVGFLSDLNSEDPEMLGQAIKKIKRQIKRAFGEAAEQISYERILVSGTSFGHLELKLNEDRSLPNAKGIHLVSSLLQNSEAGWAGNLCEAKYLVDHVLGIPFNQRSTEANA